MDVGGVNTLADLLWTSHLKPLQFIVVHQAGDGL
jgi:hypothetical protein